MRIKRIMLVGILIAVAASVGVLVALMAGGGDNLSERVANAAAKGQTFFENDVERYRYRTTSIQTQMIRDRRDIRAGLTETEVYFEVIADVVRPNKIRMSWETYYAYENEPGARYGFDCLDMNVVVDPQSYARDYDGVWTLGRKLGVSPIGTTDTLSEMGIFMVGLESVVRRDAENLRGATVDVYEGTYLDGSVERNVVVKIGREQRLVRYFKSTSLGFFWEVERWGIDSPDVVVEVPILSEG